MKKKLIDKLTNQQLRCCIEVLEGNKPTSKTNRKVLVETINKYSYKTIIKSLNHDKEDNHNDSA